MSQPLLNFLDSLGRFPHANLYAKQDSTVFNVQQWKAENLFKVWSPKTGSPWFPYAKATLFASADSNKQLVLAATGVVSKPLQDRLSGSPSLSWTSSGTAIMVDLPQDESVIVGAHFAERYGFQPVALFNNWPHVRGVVNCEVVLTGLIALASQMASVASKTSPQRPPLFIVESSRLGNRQPNENDFDNRYFLSEEDLPPSSYLKQHGITRFYYIHEDLMSGNPYVETDDLNPYFCTLAKEGIQIFKVSVDSLDKPEPYQPQERKTVLSSFSLFESSTFRRAAAGGFGALVPPRSSGA